MKREIQNICDPEIVFGVLIKKAVAWSWTVSLKRLLSFVLKEKSQFKGTLSNTSSDPPYKDSPSHNVNLETLTLHQVERFFCLNHGYWNRVKGSHTILQF